MSAYMIIQGKVTKPEQFAEYAAKTPKLIEKFGGRYLALGRDLEVLEGEWNYQAVVISEWESMDAAKKFWDSPEYAELKKIREGSIDVTVLLVNGLQP
ncbi:MAG: DUF1330 domain-containing protein [Gammaproteobacteria bacterium]